MTEGRRDPRGGEGDGPVAPDHADSAPGDEIAQATGLDDAALDRLIDGFYARARLDPLLGPVFEARLGPDGWPAHLAGERAFWRALARLSEPARLRGMAVHAELGVGPEHFARWLEIFRAAAADAAPPEGAARLTRAAERMARALQRR
jgi:hemoglobin